MALRVHRLLVLGLAALAACENLEEPRVRGTSSKLLAASSVVGTLEGSVYFVEMAVGAVDGTVYRVDPNGGGSATPITTGSMVRVAPGGARLAVVRGGGGTLVTMDADGGNPRTLAVTGPSFLGLAWSPDGKKVAGYYDGLSTASKIRVFNDAPGGGFEDIAAPSRPGDVALDWRGGTWAIARTATMNSPLGLAPYWVSATGAAMSGVFSDTFTPTWSTFGSGFWSPEARVVRLDAAGTLYFAGTKYEPFQQGIFAATGALRLNTGRTQDFAFSPKGDAVAAIRRTINGSTNTFNLDVIDWSGPYIRTLHTSQFTSGVGTGMFSVDWSRPIDASPPLAAIHYLGSGTPNEFNFDGLGSTTTAAGATITGYAWNFGDGTTASGASVVHLFQAPGEHVVTLKVTDSNGLEASMSVTLSAQLAIATVTTAPEALFVGDKFTIDVDVHNEGGVPVTGVTPSVAIASSTIVRVDSGPKPGSIDLAAGTHQHFTFYATALSAGSTDVLADAHGVGPSGTVNAVQRKRNITVNGAGISVQLAATPQLPDAGSQFTVTATLTNLGTVDLVNIVGVLTTNPSTGVNILGSAPASITRLAPGAKADLVWKVTAANPGALAVSVLASGHEDNTDALERRGSGTFMVMIADRRLVVTTTGDEALSDQQLTDRICDIEPNKEGNQCTLRAALQLAKQIGGAQTITFNIPGTGVPTIGPASALPEITVPITLDATTQAGGWVQLSGAAAGDGTSGLVINEGPTLVRGLVVNDWKGNGILVRSGSVTIRGNRIGTDAGGSARRGNGQGIMVSAGTVTIGGVSGTSADTCAGDCNLISGNGQTGILIEPHATVTVVGNWIGTNVTGTSAVPNRFGVGVLDGDSHVQIGDSTGRPGRAPGNLISGNTVSGIAVDHRQNTWIVGNVIGLDRTGTRMLPVKSDPPSAGESGVSLIVGGFARTELSVVGNVIGGFQTGIEALGASDGATVLIRKNRIGTTVDGSAAVPNDRGITAANFENSVVTIRANQISGNKSWGVIGGTAVIGNLIGTDSTGTRPVPNGNGVNSVKFVGSDRPANSRACIDPCNLISGNAGVAVSNSGNVSGNFIGTDLSGMLPLPNEGGLDLEVPEIPNLKAVVYGVRQLGGVSGATSGVCDRACNLIAGNVGQPVVVQGGDELPRVVQGNVIGAAIDGHALRSQGRGILVVHSAPAPQIGGDVGLGNLIVNSAGPAVEVQSAQGGAVIRSNGMTHNADAIVYADTLRFRVPAPPIVESVTRTTSGENGVLIHGTASGRLGTAQVDVYASASCEAGHQGFIPLGGARLSDDGDGTWDRQILSFPPFATVVVATVTIDGVTSLFSNCQTLSGPVTVTAATPAGADRLPVTSNAPFTVTGWARLNRGSSNQEWKKIRAFGSLIFASPLAFDHSAGEPVEPADAPPAAGWLLTMTGGVTAFGGAPALSSTNVSQRTVPFFTGTATPTGRGLWVLTANGGVQTFGDATSYGDASSQLGPDEVAVSILPISMHGYLIVTSRGRVVPFGDGTSLGDAPRPPNDLVVKAVPMPDHRGYLLITACGAVIGVGETGNLNSGSSGRCNVVSAAVPSSGVGVWLLHGDGRVDALGGAPSFPQTTPIPNGVGIAAEGDGYIIADAIGRMYAFGVTAPTAVAAKSPIVAVVAVPH